MIKAVSFDIGGTLVRFEGKQSLRQMLEKESQVELDLFKGAYNEHFIKRSISLSHFCELTKCTDISKIDQLISDYYATKPTGSLYDDVLYTVKELKSTGIFLMTISNKSYRNPTSLASYGLNMYFDAEIYSCDVGSAKPEIEIFCYAQKLAKVKPHEIIHVGDSIRSDVLGAKAALWNTVFLQRDAESQEQDNISTMEPHKAGHIITSLAQLFPVIK